MCEAVSRPLGRAPGGGAGGPSSSRPAPPGEDIQRIRRTLLREGSPRPLERDQRGDTTDAPFARMI